MCGLRVHSRTLHGAPPGAPPLVLVHGVCVSSRYMLPAAVALAPDFAVRVPDLPGFGLSGRASRPLAVRALAEALIAWLDAAGIDRAALLGNSVGCQIAVEAALEAPDRVGPLILTGPTMDAAARAAAPQIARWLRNARGERLSQTPALARDLADAGLRRPIALFRSALAQPIEERLEGVTQPVLVTSGDRDPVVPERWARRVAAAAPNGRYAELPGPHNTNYSEPYALARATCGFLAENRPGAD